MVAASNLKKPAKPTRRAARFIKKNHRRLTLIAIKGFTIALVEYNFDWGGQNDNVLKNVNVTLKPFALNKDNSESVVLYVSKKIEKFDISIKTLFENRRKDIDDFINKTNK